MKRLYIGGLSPRLDKEEILEEFLKYGRVTELKLLDGFGFVEYETCEVGAITFKFVHIRRVSMIH
jgi:RNA recognition motif-containing protein